MPGEGGDAAGSFCPAKADWYVACPNNTYSEAGSDSDDDCLTLAGFYADRGSAGMPCPEGFYCPAGSVRARACPSNTESKEGSTSVLDCTVWSPCARACTPKEEGRGIRKVRIGGLGGLGLKHAAVSCLHAFAGSQSRRDGLSIFSSLLDMLVFAMPHTVTQ